MNKIGILDPEGINNNPLTNEPYSNEYKKLALLWSKFPAYQEATTIIDSIKNNQVLLIVSGTGSGKTVLLPKFALHAFDYKKKIAITLPKQIIAKSASEFSAKTLDIKLGDHVGYQFKGSDKKMRSSNNKLLYATDGTIVARLLNDPLLSDFDCVIIDEAHERKIQIDFLLYLLKETLNKRPEFKVIIMSATVNSKIFSSYFSNYKFKMIDVGEKTNFDIESIYLDKLLDPKNILNEGIRIILNLLKEDKPGDILMFVSSSNETLQACTKIANELKTNEKTYNIEKCKDGVYCVGVFSGMNKDNQELAQDKTKYKDVGDYCRKIVIATNVAESSLTIDGIQYVIDSGVELKSSYDPVLRASRLELEPITKAQVKQRKGRTGRTNPGVCYHLYTKDYYESMDEYPEADILLSNITTETLRFLNLERIKTVSKLESIYSELIEPPKKQYQKNAITTLKQLGLIENDQISILGKFVSELNVEPEIGIALVVGYHLFCKNELIIIYTMIQNQNSFNNYFITPEKLLKNKKYNSPSEYKKALKHLQNKFNTKINKFVSSTGDHLSLIKLFNSYDKEYRKKNNEKLHSWANENFINLKSIRKSHIDAKRLNQQLRSKFENFNFDTFDIKLMIDKNESLNNKILFCLYFGYRLNIAMLKNKNYNTLYAENVQISKNSSLYKSKPKEVFFYELFISSDNSTLNYVSKLQPKIKNLIN